MDIEGNSNLSSGDDESKHRHSVEKEDSNQSSSPIAKRRFRALSPDSMLMQYNHECQCSECENQDLPEKLPDLPLSLDSLLVKDVSDKALKAKLPKAWRIDSMIQASASAQLTKDHLINMLKEIKRSDCPETVTVVDLRQESHGFANGVPFSWYRCRNLINLGKTRSGAMFSETEALENLQENVDNGLLKTVTLHEIRVKLLGSVYTSDESILKSPFLIQSEEQLCESLGIQYVRFPVIDHHHPDEVVVDSFVRFIRSLLKKNNHHDSKAADEAYTQKRQWLHFHCKGGRGRSTSFIVMYNMLFHHLARFALNNSSVEQISDSFGNKAEDFVRRQYELGGSQLFKPPKCKNKQWKMASFKSRERFIRKFFKFCNYIAEHGTDDTGNPSWSDWIENMKEMPNE